jgi:hypothetical protein
MKNRFNTFQQLFKKYLISKHQMLQPINRYLKNDSQR